MRKRSAIVGLLLCIWITANLCGQEMSAVKPNAEVDFRVESILKKLTVQQELDLIGGEDSFYVRAVPSAGLPRLKMSDASVGVRTWGPSPAYPASIALAASWDPELAYQVGISLGFDSRARGVHFLLGPGVNIYRAPMNGRNFEYMGEDPYLASRIAVKFIEGVQSTGVVATVKHYAANNSEYDRHNTSSDLDERTLREIYLPPFEAAVKEANVGAIMDSYNLINGVHATQNDWLNNQIARSEWGFGGIIMSDWHATYNGLAAAKNGLDLEMPSAAYMSSKNLLPAIQSGALPKSVLDEKVRRIIRTAVRFGFLDRPQQENRIPLDSSLARSIALQEARESIVLLKNEASLLPLDAKSICSLAVIGPDAWPAISGGGGSSHASPYSAVSVMNGLTHFVEVAHSAEKKQGCPSVLYDRGLQDEGEFFRETNFTSGAKRGLKEEIFAAPDLSGRPVQEAQREHLTMEDLASSFSGHDTSRVSVRWSGEYLPSKRGPQLIYLAASHRGAYKLTVDGKVLIERKENMDQSSRWAEFNASPGRSVHVEIDFLNVPLSERVGVGIAATSDLVTERAKAIAAKADAVVLAVGYDQNTEGEGYDRTFELPWGQNELIQQITRLNKKTIVAVTAGGGVDMASWIEKVAALVYLWYPGEEGGTALADVVFGSTNPEGKLPVSIENAWKDNPVHDTYYPTSGIDAVNPHIRYGEGVFLGYRYYTSSQVKPLFPFGFGLSYTTFRFSNLVINPASAEEGHEIHVSLDVTNIGKIAGSEVTELYISDPSATVKRPFEELKSFQKVHLQPGETKRVSFSLDKRAFAYWNEANHEWRIDPGKFTVMLGNSSDHLPLQGDLTLR